MGQQTGGLGAAGSVMKISKMTRFARMMGKFGKVFQLVRRALARTNSVALIAVSKVGGSVLLMSLWCHVNACCWYYVGRHGWVAQMNIRTTTLLNRYLLSLSYAMAQLQGSTDVMPGGTAQERIYHVGMLVGCIVILALFLSQLTTA